MDTRKAVFKSAGGNLIDGTITASEPGRIAFTLSRGDPPDFDLVWDEASATLTWIAIPNILERSAGFERVHDNISAGQMTGRFRGIERERNARNGLDGLGRRLASFVSQL